MKTLITILTLAASTTFAAAKTETINTKGMTALYGFNCITPFGGSNTPDRRQWSELKDPNGHSIKIIPHLAQSELDHKALVADGCDFTKMDKIQNDSFHHFGFTEVNITLTKQTGTSFRNGAKECVADYHEILEVDLGQGVTLKSEEYRQQKMTDCL